jgi:hypothetical protein
LTLSNNPNEKISVDKTIATMDAIVQAILNHSKLEVDLIRIENTTPTSYIMTIESRVTKTGPISSTMTPMVVDLVGPKGVFGKLSLPEVKTSSSGAKVVVHEQKIDIVDHDAFVAFVRSIQLDEKLTLGLDNGQGSVKAMFLTANIVYKKEVHMLGMNGPRTELVKTEVHADGTFTNTMKIINPSPLEIDLGTTTFAFKNAAGEVLAEQTGKVFIPRGDSTYTINGTVKQKGSVDKVSLIGMGVAEDSWIKETIKIYDVPIQLTPELTELLKA